MENTKVISCRLPFNEYIELLKKVNDKGLNVNDFLLSKVFCEPDSEREKIQSLELDCTQKLVEITELQTQIEDLQSELSSQERMIIELQTKEKKQAQQLVQALQECRNKEAYASEKQDLIKKQNIDYQQLISKSNQEKTKLLNQIADLEKTLDKESQRLTDIIKEKDRLIADLKRKCQNNDSELVELTEKLNTRDNRKTKAIERLEAEYYAKENELEREYKSKFARLEQAEKQYKSEIQILVFKTIENFNLNTWQSQSKIKDALKTEISGKLAV
jgi:chromosome segregation ATPase